jgi:glycolate oxidase iron-sulfur subunit
LPGLSAGDLEAALSLARQNIIELEKNPRAVVVVDDSSCAATVKDYPSLFKWAPDWRARAEALAVRTKDLSEWIAEKAVLPLLPSRVVIAYHDPCKARYAQGIVDPPRQILRKCPGVELREIPEAEQCCGGGGTYSFLHPEISRQILARKAAHIDSTGAEIVLTSSVSCLLQLKFGLRRAKSKVKAMHLAEFLAGEKSITLACPPKSGP